MTPNSTLNPGPAATRIDIRDYFRIVVKRKWWLIVPFLVAVATGTTLALVAKPVYRSTAVLYLERPQQLTRELGTLIQVAQSNEEAARLRELLTSTRVLQQVIALTKLLDDPTARRWAEHNRSVHPQLSTEELTQLYLMRRLRSLVKVTKGRAGDVFSISIEDNDPDAAQRVTAALSDAFVTSARSSQLDALRATGDFGMEQVAVYKERLQESERRLSEFKGETLRGLLAQQLVSGQNLPLLRTLRSRADVAVSEARGRLERRERELAAAGLNGARVLELLESPASRAGSSRLDSLEVQRSTAALGGASDARADLERSLDAEALRVRREIEADFLARASASLPGRSDAELEELVDLAMLQLDVRHRERHETFLQGLHDAYEHRATAEPDREIRLRDLEMEVARNREVYEAFLQQTMATRVSEAFQNVSLGGRFSIMEPADRPLEPVRPKRGMMIALAVFAGLVLGLGAVFVVDYHDHSVRSVEALEKELGARVIATLPRFDVLRSKRGRRVSREGKQGGRFHLPASMEELLATESVAAFEMRKLLLTLKHGDPTPAAANALPHTILVTSSERAEGKTLSSLLLAAELARSERCRVALLDLDLRQPSLDSVLGISPNGSSVAQALRDGHVGTMLELPVGEGFLAILQAGKLEEVTPSELLSPERVLALLTGLRERYDYVVLDSPPCVPIPDPLVIGRVVEATVFVVRAGGVPLEIIRRGLRLQRSASDNLIGIVVNDVGDMLPSHYRRGYYGKQYGAKSHDKA